MTEWAALEGLGEGDGTQATALKRVMFPRTNKKRRVENKLSSPVVRLKKIPNLNKMQTIAFVWEMAHQRAKRCTVPAFWTLKRSADRWEWK